MPRQCTICSHPEKDAINKALVAGGAIRKIAQDFALSYDALYRHSRAHLPATLAKAHEAEEVAHADDLLAEMQKIRKVTLAILTRAVQADEKRIALQAIREARGNLELLGRLEGQLQEAQTVNILIMPEWVTVRAALLVALRPYPDARAAAAEALVEIGGDDGPGK